MHIRSFEGNHPQITAGCYVDPSAVVLGRVTMAEGASIWPNAVLRGDNLNIEIGKRSNVQDGCVLHVTHDSQYTPGGQPLHIGDDVTIGHNAVVHACTVGDRVIIGMNATLLDGAVIEDDVMIGAGSVVTSNKRLESGYLYLGAPAKQVRKLSKKELELIRYSAINYVKLGARFAAEYSN